DAQGELVLQGQRRGHVEGVDFLAGLVHGFVGGALLLDVSDHLLTDVVDLEVGQGDLVGASGQGARQFQGRALGGATGHVQLRVHRDGRDGHVERTFGGQCRGVAQRGDRQVDHSKLVQRLLREGLHRIGDQTGGADGQGVGGNTASQQSGGESDGANGDGSELHGSSFLVNLLWASFV